MIKCICDNCGKIFWRASLNAKCRHTFCSKSCSAKYNNRNRMPRSEESRHKTRCSINKYYSKNPEKLVHFKNKALEKINSKSINQYVKYNLIDGEFIVEILPKICIQCGRTFIPKRTKTGRISRSKTCSDECNFKLRQKRSKEVYHKLVNEGRFQGWKTRNIISYAERFWIDVLNNNNIVYIKEKKDRKILSWFCYTN